jgi:uncharacterized membrane protein
MMDRLKNFLLTTLIGGITVILPIVIFLWVIKIIVQLVGAVIAPLSSLPIFESLDIPHIVIDLLAIAVIVFACFATGLFVRTRFGNAIYHYIEKHWLERLPIYSSIRDIVQQFTGKKRTAFQQVVILSPYGANTKMTGFVTDEDGDDFTVFVPTAPNPTNGFVFHMKRDQLTFIDVKTEEAMRTVVGMGAGSQSLIKYGEGSTTGKKS